MKAQTRDPVFIYSICFCESTIASFPSVDLLDIFLLQDFINQLVEMETVITRARSLRAKFAVNGEDHGEATDELEK